MRTIEVTWRVVSGAECASALGLLGEAERAVAARFRDPLDRAVYVHAHAMLATTLDRHGAPVPPCYVRSAWGKPALPDGPHFSLSHTRGLAACAIDAAHPVGIDVERVEVHRDLHAIALLVFTPEERDWLDRRAGGAVWTEGFFTLWTMKEAVMKAVGLGFSLDAVSFVVDAEAGCVLRAADARARGWAIRCWNPADGFRAALAYWPAGDVAVEMREVAG